MDDHGTHETCGRHRRTSSRSCSAGNRHRHSRRTDNHHHVLRSCRRPWSSCGQCGRPRRTGNGVSGISRWYGCVRQEVAYLVALSAGSTTAGTTSRGRLGAVTANVTSSSAAVACLGILGTLGAVTACDYQLCLLARLYSAGATHSCDPRLFTE